MNLGVGDIQSIAVKHAFLNLGEHLGIFLLKLCFFY